MAMSSLPAQGSTSWYTYAQDLDAAARNAGRRVAYDVRDYGATGGNATVDGPGIAAALAAANTAGGGVVIAPKLAQPYLTNAQLVIPNKVELCSDSRETTIKAGPSFPNNTALVRLGDGTALVFGTRVRNLTLDCNSVTGSDGVYTTDVNEQSGLFSVVIYNFRRYGYFAEHPHSAFPVNPSNVAARDLEVYPSASGATYGIYYKEVAGASNPIENVTVGVNGTLTAGVRTEYTNVQILGFHAETCTDGIDVDHGTGYVIGADGHSSVTNVVHLRASSPYVVAVNVRSNGATNLLLDDFGGVTLPKTINGAEHLSFYSGAAIYLGGFKLNPEGGALASYTGDIIATGSTGAGKVFEAQRSGDAQRRWAVDTDGLMEWGPGSGGRDTYLYRPGANVLRTFGKFLADGGLGVGNSATATTLGTLSRKMEVFDNNGNSIGFVPIYTTIT